MNGIGTKPPERTERVPFDGEIMKQGGKEECLEQRRRS